MIQTSYVPLEHPYQIIEYNGMLGIQIGTLIVTKDMSVDKKGGYAIETHSHPVVSYFNKQESLNQRKQNSMSVQRPFEGVVWDKVELYELSVLAREGERMSWCNYMSYCRKLRLGELEGTIKDAELLITNTYGQLLDWGIDMLVPELSKDGEYILNVEVDELERNGKNYLYTSGDMGIIVEKDDTLMMIGNIKKQAKCYLSIINYFYNCRCKVVFWTGNLFLQDFTDELKKHSESLIQDEYVYDEDEDVGIWMAAEDLPDVDDNDLK